MRLGGVRSQQNEIKGWRQEGVCVSVCNEVALRNANVCCCVPERCQCDIGLHTLHNTELQKFSIQNTLFLLHCSMSTVLWRK